MSLNSSNSLSKEVPFNLDIWIMWKYLSPSVDPGVYKSPSSTLIFSSLLNLIPNFLAKNLMSAGLIKSSFLKPAHLKAKEWSVLKWGKYFGSKLNLVQALSMASWAAFLVNDKKAILSGWIPSAIASSIICNSLVVFPVPGGPNILVSLLYWFNTNSHNLNFSCKWM